MNSSDLTQLALVGTQRQAPQSAGAPGTPLGELVAQLDPASRERFLLSSAALILLHERAGALPARDGRAPPEACPPERGRTSHRAGTCLLSLLGGEHADLLSEWLQLAASTQQLAPPETLPGLLALGVSQPEMRHAILPVLGERGHWLARQNPAWNWPAGGADDEAVWQTGEPPARLLYVQRLRRANPSRARELLAATWNEESPDDRAVFLRTLAAGLSPEDEPFLESALDDKRKEVRRAAAELLARLPGSALVRRMIQRTAVLLRFTPAQPGSKLRLKKAKKPTLELTLPAACDKSLQRDGVEPKPPSGIGEKAWWLIQMLEIAPLTTWTEAWNCAPGDILAASFDGEWKKELFEAWVRAAVRQQNAHWAEALLEAALDMKRLDQLEPLLAALPPDRREACLTAVLSADEPKTRDQHSALLLQCRHQWSAKFSRAVLSWLRRITAQQSSNWQLRNQIGTFAVRMAPETLAEAGTGWPTDSPGWEFWAKGVEDFIAAAHFRRDMRQSILQEA